VTYHGPGQLLAYLMIDLRRSGLLVRALIDKMEAAVIETLASYDLSGARKDGAPGVYIDGVKISALGLKVSRGCSFHGLALNVAMDLEPFGRINPCGFPGLKVTDIASQTGRSGPGLMDEVAERLSGALLRQLNATTPREPLIRN
jgi:lipoyl(octanoyl) transferase